MKNVGGIKLNKREEKIANHDFVHHMYHFSDDEIRSRDQ